MQKLYSKVRHFYINKYLATPVSRNTYYLCYSNQYKTLWYRVAKVATRTIDAYFKESTTESSGYIYSSEVGYFPKCYENYFKFAFVRHPVDRLLSAWKNKVVESNYFGFDHDTWLAFQNIECFIEWMQDLNINKCDQHIRSQSSLIDLRSVDFIGRFEFFARDFRKVVQETGLPNMRIPHNNASHKREIILCSSALNKVHSIYYNDLNSFGYH